MICAVCSSPNPAEAERCVSCSSLLSAPGTEARPAGDGAATGDARLEALLGEIAAAPSPGLAPGYPLGHSIGPYRLLERIGGGGMGEVFKAEQTTPIHRHVALKIIKVGMDTREVVARFEAERQALALMDHPAIAKVFEGGATSEGRPYFAMEHVKGEPISTYCDRHRLPTRERIELFILVCEGVQHAHQKGVIHRDLKPSNVLVTVQDDRPVPKIIDFGVAKATTQHLTERTLFTELGVLIGTPEYMSPEQAELTGLDIDTRTDVYALGVLLYELLTGALPFDRKLREQGLDAIRRTIRETEPARPSTRISQLGPISTEAARSRRTEPARLASELRGDLDWITMKALEKDRTRRYATANALGADLRRYLNQEPVSAGPPSAAYRARKFVGRHRFGVGAAAAVVLVLVAFAATMLVQAQRLARERDRANAEAGRANLEAAAARQVSDFLVGLFKVSDPSEARGNSVTAREILDKGVASIGGALADQPVAKGRLLHAMGEVYLSLGLYAEGQSLLEQALATRRGALGDEHRDTLESMSGLAAALFYRGNGPEAVALQRKALELQRRVLGELDKATLQSEVDLGAFLIQAGKLEEAELVCRAALQSSLRALGEEHEATVTALNNLGAALRRQGKLAEAEPYYRRSLKIGLRVLGDSAPLTLDAMANLGTLLDRQGNKSEAEQLLRRTLDARQRVLGATHPETMNSMNLLAVLLCSQQKYSEAQALFARALAGARSALTEGHPRFHSFQANYGECLARMGRYGEAERLLSDSHSGLRGAKGEADPGTQQAIRRLAALYDAWGKPDKAAEWRAKLTKGTPAAR